jgi:long-chain acyl-CoA synthetase
MLSHNNLVSNVKAIVNLVPFPAGKAKELSFLPVCHILNAPLYIYINIMVFPFILGNL